MPIIINSQTGLAEDLPLEHSTKALEQGTHAIPLNDPQGNPVSVPYADASGLLEQGYSRPSQEQYTNLLKTAELEPQTGQAGALGLLEGTAGPLGTMAYQGLSGRSNEDIRGLKELHPYAHGAGELAGFAGSMAAGFGAGHAVTEVGQAAAKASGLTNTARSALQVATEMAVLQSGDEVSKLLTNDPHQSVESAAANIGLSALLGGGLGTAGGLISPLWKSTVGEKLGQAAEDFKGQLKFRLDNPNPEQAVATELQAHYDNVKSLADEVYGANGLKSQDIAKVMPQMNDKIVQHTIEHIDNLKEVLGEMKLNPDTFPSRYTAKIEGYQADLQRALDTGDSANVFDTMQRTKQELQEYAKYSKRVPKTDASYDFVQKAKELASDFREGLESTEVWGKAGERQHSINKAFSEYLPSLKDFEKKFTVEVNGERQLDPSKVGTYVNQVMSGKASASIKKDMLGNFLEASEKYQNEIGKIHSNLGIDNPIPKYSLSTAKGTLEDITPGARLANAFVDKSLAKLVGHGVGALTGGTIGRLRGMGGIGALIGERALGPALESVIPALSKSMLETIGNGAGFKAALDYGITVAKGEAALVRASKNLFKAGSEVVPKSLLPDERSVGKLEKMITVSKQDPASLINVGGDVGHYLPGHNVAMGETAARAVNYLDTIRPSTAKPGPLDEARVPSAVEKAHYMRAMALAEQPMMLLQHVKDGTITSSDITTVSAIYPNLLQNMRMKAMDALITHTSKDQSVPYRTRIGLTMLLGQAVDSSLTQQSIVANQAVAVPPMGQQAPPSVGKGTNVKNLNKLSGMYGTPMQSREQARMK